MIHRLAAVAAVSAVVALATIFAAGCGGDSQSSGGASTAGGTPSPVSIEVTETDDGFVPAAISVERGQLLHLTFVNKGQIIHNLRIAGPSGQFGGSGDVVLGSPVVQPGQSASADWQAPSKAGKRAFRCDVHPNHTGAITIR